VTATDESHKNAQVGARRGDQLVVVAERRDESGCRQRFVDESSAGGSAADDDHGGVPPRTADGEVGAEQSVVGVRRAFDVAQTHVELTPRQLAVVATMWLAEDSQRRDQRT